MPCQCVGVYWKVQIRAAPRPLVTAGALGRSHAFWEGGAARFALGERLPHHPAAPLTCPARAGPPLLRSSAVCRLPWLLQAFTPESASRGPILPPHLKLQLFLPHLIGPVLLLLIYLFTFPVSPESRLHTLRPLVSVFAFVSQNPEQCCGGGMSWK